LADSLSAGAKTAIEGMLSFYQGGDPGGIPGIFNEAQGYYWWIAGAAWNVEPSPLFQAHNRHSCNTGG